MSTKNPPTLTGRGIFSNGSLFFDIKQRIDSASAAPATVDTNAFTIQSGVDALAFAVEAAIDAIAAALQVPVDAVTFTLQVIGPFFMTAGFCPVGPAVQTVLDTIPSTVQAGFNSVAPSVQAVLYAVPLAVKAVPHRGSRSVGLSPCHGGQPDGDQCSNGGKCFLHGRILQLV
jgi:hypothetical protein